MRPLLLFIFFALMRALPLPCAHAEEQSFMLKAGALLGVGETKTFESARALAPAGGFHTHFSYRWERWELLLSSFVTVSPLSESRHRLGELEVSGSGFFRSVYFGAPLKYTFPLSWGSGQWYPTLSLSYLIGLQTYKLDSFSATGGEYQKRYKITYQAQGARLAVGLEQRSSKKDYPLNWELSYRVMRPTKMSLVGGTLTEVEVLAREEVRYSGVEQALLFSVGIVLF